MIFTIGNILFLEDAHFNIKEGTYVTKMNEYGTCQLKVSQLFSY